MGEPRRLVCSFLVPVVADGDRRPHSQILWRQLTRALLASFGGLTGPETVLCYRWPAAVVGSWLPEPHLEPVEDESRRYCVAVPEDRIDELRDLVLRAGNSFGQRAMYLEVGGVAEILEIRPEDGNL